jgi:carbonic anhydrase
MHKLVAGIHAFQERYFSSHKEMFERLARGQQPRALFITCADSRIDPSLLTQTEPGELFILRNAGNIVPAYGSIVGGEAGTIEFAVCVLKIKNIIVCGHSHCGAMQGLLHPDQLVDLPAVRALLSHAEATGRIIKENYTHLTDEASRMRTAIQENVLVQLENLRTHPSVAAALGRDELKLHGWVYTLETGQVFEFDARQRQFVPIEQPAGTRTK